MENPLKTNFCPRKLADDFFLLKCMVPILGGRSFIFWLVNSYPIGSTYGIFYLHLPLKSPNVGKYTTHGWYGYCCMIFVVGELERHWWGSFHGTLICSPGFFVRKIRECFTLRIQVCPKKGINWLTLQSYCGDGIGTIKPTLGKGMDP